MHLAEVGNGVVIGPQVLQQPLQFNIAAALPFQLTAAAYFIEVAVQVQL
jgi:hypothetical protein